jgi:hypothetical protein
MKTRLRSRRATSRRSRMRSRRRRKRRDARRMRNSGGRSRIYSSRWTIIHSGKQELGLHTGMAAGT